jgi:hypothetical protein
MELVGRDWVRTSFLRVAAVFRLARYNGRRGRKRWDSRSGRAMTFGARLVFDELAARESGLEVVQLSDSVTLDELPTAQAIRWILGEDLGDSLRTGLVDPRLHAPPATVRPALAFEESCGPGNSWLSRDLDRNVRACLSPKRAKTFQNVRVLSHKCARRCHGSRREDLLES